MTHGDQHRIACPHCKKPASIAAQVAGIRHGEIREVEQPCPHCGRSVYYWIRWAVVVDAEKPERAR